MLRLNPGAFLTLKDREKMLKQFYEKALPNEGYYCVAYNIPNSKAYVHDYASSIDEVVELIQTHVKEERNVFVAMSTFNEQDRKASKSIFVKSFYLDLDVGESKDYQTQKEALIDLSNFLETSKLPMPAIVNSGNGIHAYWFLKEQITVEEWKPLATQLKNLCVAEGLKIDLAITADGARLLRCPNTVNYKKTPPSPTLVVKDAEEYDLKVIKTVLDNVEIPLEELVKKSNFTDEEKRVKYGNYENHFKPLLIDSMQENEDGCAQIKHYIDNAKTADEPLWWRVLSLAQNCVDRDDVIHVISKDHVGYSYDETEEKATLTDGKPHTCKDFNNVSPGICTSCPHWQTISTPIQLHKVTAKAEPVEESVELIAIEGEVLPVIHKKKNGLPQTLDDKGYWLGAKQGGIFKSITTVDKKGATLKEDLLVYEYDMFAIRHLKSNADGNCLVINVMHPHDGTLEFLLPMKSVYDPTELRKTLTSQGIYYDSRQQEELIMRYFIDWAKDMQRKNKYDVMYDQMGWNEDHSSFVAGNIEMSRDGTEKITPISPLARPVAPFVTKSGTYEGWKIAAQKLNQNGMEMHMFTMLCGFGSVLMTFSSTNGVVISLTGESGAAKTGALKAAISIWGEPENLYVQNITANALQGRFLTLHNLPMGFDEVGNKNPYLISDFILGVSQGKAKVKMQASTNSERDYEAPSSLIAIMTSNHSLIDKLKQIRSNPNGEVARLIEFSMRKPKSFIDNARLGKEIFDEFNVHYGWAGPDFIRALYKYGDKAAIKANLGKWENRFVADFGNDTAYRFYENLVAVTMTAAEIVVDADILVIDIERIYKFIVGEMISIKDETVKINDVDYESVLANYLDSNIDKVLAFSEEGNMISEPRNQLAIRIEHAKDYMWISKKEFDAYLAELPISTKEFVYQMKQMGVGVDVGAKIKQRMNAGWVDVQKSATAVYRFKLSTIGKTYEVEKLAATQ